MHRPDCYGAAKLDAHVKAKVAAKPDIVQNQHGHTSNRRKVRGHPPHKYSRSGRKSPDTPEKAKLPEFKTCKYTAEAIVSDASNKGELRKV